jgi:hypothetical protein
MNSQEFQNNELKTAVLFLVFNRPDTTRQVFEAIRQAKPARLYVAADGIRKFHEGEAELIAMTRKIATAVDWPCEVKTLFREKNLGIKNAVESAITWFFQHEEQGIILEDDCLPHQDFFQFCETLLSYYRYDERISMITGNNYQAGHRRGEGSYYFSQYNVTWGWASWRRAWKHYDGDLNFWPTWKLSTDWKKKFSNFFERKYWERVFDRTFAKQIDTWDYQWHASICHYGGLTVTPNVNLVSNIGFGPNATNFKSFNSPLARIATSRLGEIIHPKVIIQDQVADRFLFNSVYSGRLKKFPLNLIVIIYFLVKKFINRN